MTQSSSNPESENTPRGKLARHLRQARLDAGFATQPPFAARLKISVPLVSMIENGRHVPPRDLLDLWLDTCQVPELVRPYLIDFWTCAKTTSSGVREFFQKYFDAEQRATFLRMWGLLLIPGPLQVREYAEAIFRKEELEEEEVAEQTDLRMQRRARVDGPDPAQVTAIVYERALYYQVGASTTMIGQLEDLAGLSHRRNVVLQVVRDDGYFPGAAGPFCIASGPGISDTVDMVTVLDSVTDEPDPVGTVVAQFEVVRGYARSVVESRILIMEAIQWWKSQQQLTRAGVSPAIAATVAQTASRLARSHGESPATATATAARASRLARSRGASRRTVATAAETASRRLTSAARCWCVTPRTMAQARFCG